MLRRGYPRSLKEIPACVAVSLALIAVLPALCALRRRNRNPCTPIAVVKLERATPVLYDKDIEPILVNKCAVCHSDNIKEGKLDLGSYEALHQGRQARRGILPGKSANSLLVKLAADGEKVHAAQGRGAADTGRTGPHQTVDRPGRKAPATQRERPKVIVSGPPANVHPVLGVAVSPDKKQVAASRGNQIHIYDAASGKHLRSLLDPQLTTPDKKPIKAAHLSIVESLAYSPDGKTLASGAFQEVVLWDAETGAIRRRLTGFADRVVALDFSHDGKLLATGGGVPTADGEIKIFDVASGKLVD